MGGGGGGGGRDCLVLVFLSAFVDSKQTTVSAHSAIWKDL